ncbi:MAG: hypothetical protein WDZ83_10290 [Rhizobiaceae bacterium]
MPMPEERERTTIVTTGSRGGAGWFVAGGLAVLVVVALWLFGGAISDGMQTSDVNVDLPDNVDVQVDSAEPAPAEPAPQTPAPAEETPQPSE